MSANPVNQVDVNELVKAYVNVRDEKNRITHVYEEEKKALDSVLDKLKASLLEICNGLKVESLKTHQGTVFKTLKERFYTNDWEGFGKFVVDNNLIPLLEKRIHQSNFKEYLADHHDEGLPPGVNVMREFDVTVRKPAAKPEEDNE